MAPAAMPDSTASAAVQDSACARCHAEQVAHYERSAHGKAAAVAQPGAPTCLTCHLKPITQTHFAAADSARHKIEQERLCLSCHLDDAQVRARMTPGAGFIAAYEKSVHSAALHAGNAKSATCADCHGSHEMAKGFEPASRANKMHIPATCGACHEKIAKAYSGSVHGAALAKGSVDTPVCTDCHGEHTILKAKAPESPVAPANVSEKVCSPCHSSVRLSAKYGIRTDRFKTFSDSFHGLAIRGGSVSAANCASCHGSHDIRPSSDPRSTIYPARLAATCGKCHAGATAAFASGKVHLEMTESEEPLLYWIGMIYTILIAGTIGGMFIHNGFDFYRKARHRLGVRRGLEVGEAPAGRALYLRMTANERLQHGALFVSFTVLVLTGFALRYPEAWLVEGVRRFAGVLFDWRGIAHRVAGVVMVAASIWHIGYLTRTARGREFFRDILLRPSDLKDVKSAVRYYLGRTRDRPRFGRFSYVEKSEYWALVWGTIVMAATGTIMWFQDPFIAFLSKLGWDVARTVHVYEAVLATLAILVWHMYFVIFNPDVYPMNLSWLKGTLSEEEMREEHPLELEDLERRRREEEARRREGEEEMARRKREGEQNEGP
ncbi:MAG: cytochrome b/b6 domain-containing protein [Candidatus Latescibacteria bacterium]|nr:cytochrome b/b6 domain-containing protein [Candidatus Latescibacterota bacterium]